MMCVYISLLRKRALMIALCMSRSPFNLYFTPLVWLTHPGKVNSLGALTRLSLAVTTGKLSAAPVTTSPQSRITLSNWTREKKKRTNKTTSQYSWLSAGSVAVMAISMWLQRFLQPPLAVSPSLSLSLSFSVWALSVSYHPFHSHQSGPGRRFVYLLLYLLNPRRYALTRHGQRPSCMRSTYFVLWKDVPWRLPLLASLDCPHLPNEGTGHQTELPLDRMQVGRGGGRWGRGKGLHWWSLLKGAVWSPRSDTCL